MRTAKKLLSVVTLWALFSNLCLVPASAQTITPNLKLTLPPAAPNTWGESYNTNFSILDQKFPGGIPSQVTIQDETIDLNTRPKINFTGAGVVCADDAGNNRINCTIAGSATANQNANTVFAGPTSGAAAAPVFRALVDADIPTTLTGKSMVNMTVGGVATSGRYLRFDGVGGILSRLVYDVGTVAQLPGSPQNGQPFIVTDASSGSSCEVGGGSVRVHCGWNSTSGHWEPLGGLTSIQGTANRVTVTGTNPAVVNLPDPIVDGSVAYCADAGGSDAYACSLTPAPAAYIIGARYRFKANTNSDGVGSPVTTINFNGLGAKTIKKAVGGVTTDLAANDIRAGQIVDVVYDGVNMQMQSVLGNALAACGADTQVTFNDGGVCAGNAGLTFTKATGLLNSTLLTVGSVGTNSADLDTSAVTGHKTYSFPNATGTFALNDNTKAFTNTSLDAEGTGNVLTIPVYIVWEVAGCDGTTASGGMDKPTSAAATFSCTGTTTTVGAGDFVDASTTTLTRHFRLPSDWSGNVDVDLVWFANAASANAVRWSVATGCVADSEAVSTGPSYNTASASNTAYTGTANQRKTTSFTSVNVTNCAASETMWLQVQRIGGDGGDTLTATAELVEVGVKLRRAM